VLGTLNNCASGKTPWGTYLSGEENWANYFSGGDTPTPHQRRWGLRKGGSGYRWGEHDERFDAASATPTSPTASAGWSRSTRWTPQHAGQAHRAGPRRARRRLGGVTRDGRAVVYSGEDARFEYIYKFVSRDRIAPGGAKPPMPNCWTTARCTWRASTPTASGRWLPLVHGQGPLTAANGFADQGEVLIKARQASDLLGATKMDRPEWLAIDPRAGSTAR
jgi:secreted PhoX family phosphatase